MNVDETDARYVRREEMEAVRSVFMEEMRNGFANLTTTFTTSFSALADRLDQMDKRLERIEEFVGMNKPRH